jgi:calcineurin-binding protein cabin-1
LLAQSEEVSASDKWPGFVLTKEGEEFEQQNTNLFKYDLLYNPLRFESWEKLGNIYDEAGSFIRSCCYCYFENVPSNSSKE